MQTRDASGPWCRCPLGWRLSGSFAALSAGCGAALPATYSDESIAQWRAHTHTNTTRPRHGELSGACAQTNFPELPRIKKLSSFQSSVPDWSWALNLTKVEATARGHKSDWQASLWRGALWYLRWWLARQIIILPIRVPFSALWSLQRVMACSRRSASGCLRSHYPTGSSAVINDKRPEYWFVNLQSGAIRCSLQNDRNLPSEGGLSPRILASMCVWLQVCTYSLILVLFLRHLTKAGARGSVQQLQLWPRGGWRSNKDVGWCWTGGGEEGRRGCWRLVRGWPHTHSARQSGY